MSDLIERQIALNAVDAIGHIATMPDGDKCIRRSAVKYTLSMLPSAQPEQKWILCDERMPEEHEWIGTKRFGTTMSDEVYVTFENSKGERFTKHLHFHNGELSRYDKTHMDAWFKDYKPIAWMPLPEPYHPEGEEHG